MSEFWGLNVTSPMKAGVHTTRGLIHIQREARDSRRPFPSIRWYHVFWARNIKRGGSCPLVVSKRYHICDTKCIFQWYLKKYHICGTKTSIVVSKDTTYVVHFADASIKGLFSDSPFLFFECISTIKTSAETVTSVTCFGSTVILPNDSEWGF